MRICVHGCMCFGVEMGKIRVFHLEGRAKAKAWKVVADLKVNAASA